MSTLPTLSYSRCHFSTQLPVDFLYTASHFWLARDGDGWRVGFTKFATRMLGEIVEQAWEIAPGSSVTPGQGIGSIEGFKALTEIFCVVTGSIAAFNPALADDPSLISRDPYGAGWLYRAAGEPESGAMGVEQYSAFLNETIDRMADGQA